MKKLISAAAVCAVAVGLVAVPNAGAVKSPKMVLGTVTVGETPNPVVVNAPATITGNVASNSNCRKFRSVTVQWFSGTTPVNPPAPVTVVTNPNGDYAATLAAPPTAGTYTVSVTVAQAFRKVGGKHRKNKKGRQFNCVAIGPASSSPVTVNAS
jgi:hypothetical protein